MDLIKLKKIEESLIKLIESLSILNRFKCPYIECDRIYGSDISLNLHIKLKHNGLNKT